ncbi:hypothetical protein AVEN_123578-1 [Araneus ventricosus]|uniref:Uncharacterized protein n=1 Tax=Araneus ventricosus TaxID=182803 RepID=A0A4Y2VYW3_ARAVE|nr:hypothetical protein AVEN_123578-1 [Araneus ventricosus]
MMIITGGSFRRRCGTTYYLRISNVAILCLSTCKDKEINAQMKITGSSLISAFGSLSHHWNRKRAFFFVCLDSSMLFPSTCTDQEKSSTGDSVGKLFYTEIGPLQINRKKLSAVRNAAAVASKPVKKSNTSAVKRTTGKGSKTVESATKKRKASRDKSPEKKKAAAAKDKKPRKASKDAGGKKRDYQSKRSREEEGSCR